MIVSDYTISFKLIQNALVSWENELFFIIIFIVYCYRKKKFFFFNEMRIDPYRAQKRVQRRKTGVKKEENESNEKRGTLLVFSVIRETLRESE